MKGKGQVARLFCVAYSWQLFANNKHDVINKTGST